MSETTAACPKCGQQTASQFFRTVGKKQLCVLCAQRSGEADKALKDAIEDHKLHGGYGWLWKHIAGVIAVFIGYLFLRGSIVGLIRSLFGGT
jgi:Zn ribbon nucleic-acid-binding protein